MPRTWLPKDELLTSIEQEVNAKLETGCSITLYRYRDGDEAIHYGMIFVYGPRRSLRPEQDEVFFDSDRVIKDFNAWRLKVEQERDRERYTTVPPEEWEP